MLSPIWHFTAVHFWLIFGSFSTVSGAILIVLLVMCGFPLATIVAAVLGVVREAIKFFETPLGELVAIALLVIAVAVGVDIHQIRVDSAATRVAVQKALNAQAAKADEDRKARDAYVQKQVSADAEKRIAQITAEKQDLEQKAKDYETALANSKRARCTVTRGDLSRRLQN